MKRFIAFLAAMLLLCCSLTALAETTPDMASMTDDQLLKLIHACHTELADRNSQMEEVLYQNDELGFTLKMTGFEFSGSSLSLMGILINRSDKTVRIYAEDYHVYVNNWTVGCYGNRTIEAAPGRNTRSEIFETVRMAEIADVTRVSDLVTVEGTLSVLADGKQIGSIPFVFTSFPGLK
ncbi:MAG: hypothetical protein IJ343_08805 [Clostridia bacterium]|nr:hypothetical protein [Clostridia bacterium]